MCVDINEKVFSSKKKQENFILAFLYNASGNAIYLACKWLITVVVVRFSNGFEDAGSLALAMSITSIFYFFATYSIRNYQVTDITNEFSIDTYVTTRIITILASFVLCLLYSLIYVNGLHQQYIVMLYMLLIMGEAFSDVLHGIDQKYWRMDLIGLSFTIRGIIILIMFILLYRIHGLSIAILGMSLSSFLIIIFFDIKVSYKLSLFRLSFNCKEMMCLLKTCFPIMFACLLYNMIPSIAKITLENMMGVDILGIYTSATMPGIILQSIASFILVPLVNVFSQCINNGDQKNLKKFFFFTCISILIFTILSIVCVILVGDFILSWIFGNNIISYSYLLIGAMIVAGLTIFNWFLMTFLTVIHKLYAILISNLIGFVLCLLLSKKLLVIFGISGANYIQIISLSVSVISMLIFYNILKERIIK